MKRIVISGAVLALAIGGMGVGSAAPADQKVTGGGQTFLSDEPVEGPGDTIAFQAQSRGDVAQGQVQYVARGDNADKFHGVVDCLVVDGNRAWFAGDIKDKDVTEDGGRFRVDVTDNGQGTDDFVMVTRSADANCEDAPSDDDVLPILARGNVKIHNQVEEEPAS